MNIRSILLTLLMSTVISTLVANDVIINTTDARQYVISLNDNPQMTIDNGMLNVKSEKTDVSVPLQEVAGYCFHLPSGVEKVEESKPAFIFTNDMIIFNECDHVRKVSIVSPNGTVIASHTIDAGPGGYFDTRALASGVYLVNVDGVTLKILKK